MKTTYVSICGWTDKEMGFIYTMEYYLVIKEENPAACDNMHGSWGYHAKWDQSYRAR